MELRGRYKEPLAWRSASQVIDQIDSEEPLDKSLGRYSTKQTGQKCNSKPVNARESMLTNGFAIVGSDIEPFGRLSRTTVADKRWLHRLSLQLYASWSVNSKSYQFGHRFTAWSCRLPEWTAARAPLQHCRMSNRENSRQRPTDREETRYWSATRPNVLEAISPQALCGFYASSLTAAWEAAKQATGTR